jgi:hypothetical protein
LARPVATAQEQTGLRQNQTRAAGENRPWRLHPFHALPKGNKYICINLAAFSLFLFPHNVCSEMAP